VPFLAVPARVAISHTRVRSEEEVVESGGASLLGLNEGGTEGGPEGGREGRRKSEYEKIRRNDFRVIIGGSSSLPPSLPTYLAPVEVVLGDVLGGGVAGGREGGREGGRVKDR